MELSTIFICSVLIMILAKVLTGSKTKNFSKFNLPPSMNRLPVIGNAHLMKSTQPHKIFMKISKTIGPVITFWFGSRPVIIINEIDAAREALIKQDNIFAGRPQRFTGSLYSRVFKGVIVADHGENWRKTRTLAHQALKKYEIDEANTEKLIASECEDLVKRMKEKSYESIAVDVSKDIALSVMNVICSLCFGKRYNKNDAEFLRIVEANTWFFEGITCSSVVDAFPWLRYFPYKKMQLLQKYVKVRDEILEKKFQEHEENFDGEHLRDIIDHLIASRKKYENNEYLSRDNQLMLISDLFIAGSDTTSTALMWALLYLAKWPAKQERLQQELNSIIGKDQPTLKNKTKLPYLQATISEVLRLSSLTPLGVPRKTTESTRLAGYDIPKDTTVIFNFYAMNHDDSVWQNSEEFKPERFLDNEGQFHPSRMNFIPFSAGKRVCLGEKLAKMELFLILTYLASNFKFQCVEKESVDGVSGATLKPKPYKLFITNRE